MDHQTDFLFHFYNHYLFDLDILQNRSVKEVK